MTEQELTLGMALCCAGLGALAPAGLVSRYWPAGLLSAALCLWAAGALAWPLMWTLSFSVLSAAAGVACAWGWPGLWAGSAAPQAAQGPFESWEITWDGPSPYR